MILIEVSSEVVPENFLKHLPDGGITCLYVNFWQGIPKTNNPGEIDMSSYTASIVLVYKLSFRASSSWICCEGDVIQHIKIGRLCL